jgi:ADP-ribosylglycohydrolase
MDTNIARERARGCLVGMAVIAADETGKQGNRTGIQLTQIVAESLIRMRRFDLQDQINGLVDVYRTDPIYWGPSTRQAAAEHAEHIRSKGKSGRAPHHRMTIAPSDEDGCDLDVACKIAPLAIFHAVRHPQMLDPLLTDLMELGFITHGDPRATIAAAAIAMGIWNLMGFQTIPEAFPFVNAFRVDIGGLARRLEKEYLHHAIWPERVSQALSPAWRFAGSFEDIAANIPATTYALHGVPFALAAYLHRPLHFIKAVSNAASVDKSHGAVSGMVGALSGVTVGLAGIPPVWVHASQAARTMHNLADRLVDAALSP